MNYRLSHHAQQTMQQRRISSALLDSVLQQPQQIVPEPGGRKAYQSQLDFGGGNVFLLRAIVVDDVDPAIVVTVYRTKKISKYWSTS